MVVLYLLELLRVHQPLEVDALEVVQVGVVLGGGDVDRLVPLVDALVHLDGLVHRVVLQVDALGHFEVLVELGDASLDHVVVLAVATLFVVRRQLVGLAQKPSSV